MKRVVLCLLLTAVAGCWTLPVSAQTERDCVDHKLTGLYPRGQIVDDGTGHVTRASALKLASYNLAEANATEACAQPPDAVIDRASALNFRVRAGALLVFAGATARGRGLMNDGLAGLRRLEAAAPNAQHALVSAYLDQAVGVAKDPSAVALHDQP